MIYISQFCGQKQKCKVICKWNATMQPAKLLKHQLVNVSVLYVTEVIANQPTNSKHVTKRKLDKYLKLSFFFFITMHLNNMMHQFIF